MFANQVRGLSGMARVTVDKLFCKGCGLCVDVCPQSIMALDMDIITNKGYHPAICVDQAACTGCLSCALMCPDVAIKIER
jgi:2-oxoglutarate ferredoxin oxidoreductase subunit delta